jgi:hypothetical protein
MSTRATSISQPTTAEDIGKIITGTIRSLSRFYDQNWNRAWLLLQPVSILGYAHHLHLVRQAIWSGLFGMLVMHRHRQGYDGRIHSIMAV